MQDIHGQVAIVTGGSRGLGRSIVRVLGQEGCRVVAVARGREELESLEKEERQLGHEIVGIPADVTSEEEVRAVVQETRNRFDEVDILINNAGIARFARVEDISTEVFDEIVATNLKGTFLFTREIVPSMKRRRTGQIIVISSAAGVRGQPQQTVYSSTKFAQVGFVQSLDQELREYGVRVGVFNPGSINTPLWGEVALYESEKGKWAEWGSRAMNPDDVAEVLRLMVKQEANVRVLQVLMRPMAEPFE